MMGRETGVTTAGVGLRRSAGETTGALVRALGAFERMYQRRPAPPPKPSAMTSERVFHLTAHYPWVGTDVYRAPVETADLLTTDHDFHPYSILDSGVAVR
jgi:hypothetical protein